MSSCHRPSFKASDFDWGNEPPTPAPTGPHALTVRQSVAVVLVAMLLGAIFGALVAYGVLVL